MNTNQSIEEPDQELLNELLSEYDDNEQYKPSKSVQNVAKAMVRQQLALSEDSPFYQEESHQVWRDVRAAYLEHGNVELRRQLELLKAIKGFERHLYKPSEIKMRDDITQTQNNQSTLSLDVVANDDIIDCNRDKQPDTSRLLQQHQQELSMSPKTSSGSIGPQVSIPNQPKLKTHDNGPGLDREPKFRPLTGKTDCPNCNCDRRRGSICDQCNVPRQREFSSNTVNSRTNKVGAHDQTNQVVQRHHVDDSPANSISPVVGRVEVNEVSVPGRVYTISKSLDDKRTKLAQKIEDLNKIYSKVEAREKRLEQERKIVQLYKDQWQKQGQFGCAPKGMVNGLRRAQSSFYVSRLDPNLARDIKAMHGYAHVTGELRLRDYIGRKPTGTTFHKNTKTKSKSLDSLHKFASSSPASSAKSAAATSKSSNVNNSNNPSRPRGSAMKSAGSRSHTNGQPAKGVRFEDSREKSASEDNLSTGADRSASTSGVGSHEVDVDTVVEEVEDEDIEVFNEASSDERSDGTNLTSISNNNTNVMNESSDHHKVTTTSGIQQHQPRQKQDSSNDANLARRHGQHSVEKVAWFPVFGETEVKKVKSRPPTVRKIKVVAKHPTLEEASRQLRQANELLEQEKLDARTKNQIIVKQRQRPVSVSSSQHNTTSVRPSSQQPRVQSARASLPAATTHSDSVKSRQSSSRAINDTTASSVSQRLEAIIEQQQRLLEKLSGQSRQPSLSRSGVSGESTSSVSVRCSSPCCHMTINNCHQQHQAGPMTPITSGTKPKSLNNSKHHVHQQQCQSHQPQTGNNRLSIMGLRDKLNKSKLRLAKILEAEREKHQRLRLKVDSSRKKQSDLEAENELLKQSLSKCIDTCLEDISSTFDSLNDSLINSSVLITPQTTARQTASSSHQASSFNTVTSHEQRPILSEASTSDPSSSVSSGNNNQSNQPKMFQTHLTNAAKLINDNRQIKELVGRMDNSRRTMVEELGKERFKNKQLEALIEDNQEQIEALKGARQDLKARLAEHLNPDYIQERANQEMDDIENHLSSIDRSESAAKSANAKNMDSTSSPTTNDENTSKQQTPSEAEAEDSDDTTSSGIYRRYIQSIAPDLSAIREERKLILNEFDNIRKLVNGISSD